MVEATIQGILETEKQADAIVSTAKMEQQKLLEEAVERIKIMKAEQTEQLKEAAQKKLEEARKQGDLRKEEARSQVEKEVEAIKYLAKQKEDDAVEFVMQSFI